MVSCLFSSAAWRRWKTGTSAINQFQSRSHGPRIWARSQNKAQIRLNQGLSGPYLGMGVYRRGTLEFHEWSHASFPVLRGGDGKLGHLQSISSKADPMVPEYGPNIQNTDKHLHIRQQIRFRKAMERYQGPIGNPLEYGDPAGTQQENQMLGAPTVMGGSSKHKLREPALGILPALVETVKNLLVL